MWYGFIGFRWDAILIMTSRRILESPGRRRVATSIPLRCIKVAGFALSICPKGNASASSRLPFGHIGTAHCQREKNRLRFYLRR